MRRVLIVALVASLLAGCAAWKKSDTSVPAAPAKAAEAHEPARARGRSGSTERPEIPVSSAGFVERYAASRKLAQAVEMLGKGNQAGGIRELNAICSAKSMPGVTDEALFRLALISLKPTLERPISPQGQQLLKRLRKEYPASSWAVQAAPLLDLLEVADDLKQQNRNLRSANQSLNKEISDLNRTINQLKNLDLELEQKTR